MSELLSHVEQSIRARRLFVPGQRILVAVSGGLDSMVLLHLLHELAPRHGWQLTAAHLNHQLRGPSSDADERLVRRAAKRLRLPLKVERADVKRLARTQPLSLEMAARKVRHDFLARTAAQLEIQTIALAHHADDHLELFFLRLLRGAGGEGLAGMKWRNPSPCNRQVELVRPLLDQPKSSLLTQAEEMRISFREDASNACLDIQRNRIRHELLPLLRTKYQPALNRIILRTADIVGAEADFSAQAAWEWLDRRQPGKQRTSKASPGRADADQGKSKCVRFSPLTTPFENLPVAVQRHVVRLQLLNQGVVADYSHVEQLRRVANKAVNIGSSADANEPRTSLGRLPAPRPPACESDGFEGDMNDIKPPAARFAVRDPAGMVRLKVPPAEGFKSESLEVVLDRGAGKVDFGGAVIGWRVDGKRPVGLPRGGRGHEVFDADKVGANIRLRHWQPGDRFQPIGMAVSVKVQDLFTNLKVPPDHRRRRIVAATAHGEVFWVEGIRMAERFKVSKSSIRRLQWRWKRP